MDVGEETQVRERKTRHQLERERELAELHAVLQTAGGRGFLWRLLVKCHIGTFGYCGENNFLNNLEGRRWVGGQLIEEIDAADPTAYAKMRDEATSREVKLGKDQSDG
jgi:hypothetical protein